MDLFSPVTALKGVGAVFAEVFPPHSIGADAAGTDNACPYKSIAKGAPEYGAFLIVFL